jgi:hypothetical protein
MMVENMSSLAVKKLIVLCWQMRAMHNKVTTARALYSWTKICGVI